MFEAFRKVGSRGLLSRPLRRLKKAGAETRWLNQDFTIENEQPPYKAYDSSLRGYFTGKWSENFRALCSPEDVQRWVAELRNRHGKIASLDVCGQLQAGIDAGADRSFGWSLESEGDIFDPKVRARILESIDTERASPEGAKLGLVFFRPVGGMEQYGRNKYAHLYLYEFILRPLYERLVDGGVMLISSLELAGMPLLAELLKQTPGVDVTHDESQQAYMLRKRDNVPVLSSLSRMDNLDTLASQFAHLRRDQLGHELTNRLTRLCQK